jgi:hypothetical protein
MVTNEQVREMALALPEAYEEGHWGEPSFRVRKRIFAVSYASDRRVVLKLPVDYQEDLVAADPKVYSLGNFSQQGWTHVCLKAVPKAHFSHHLEAAWREVAPKRAIKAFEERH